MTNREWLLDKMQNMSDEELAVILACESRMCEIMDKGCAGGDCSNCIYPWLKSEHKEPITLSEAERIILENIDKDYKWIARDKDLELYVYKNKTNKYYKKWRWVPEGTRSFRQFNHLFQFITWKDSEPYNIAELLEGK